MIKKFSDFITEKRWYIVIFWVIAAIVTVTLSPSLSSVTSDDQASFLPDTYESATAQGIAKQAFQQSEGQSAIVLFKKSDNKQLNTEDQRQIQEAVKQLNTAGIERVEKVVSVPQMLSQNKQIQLAQVEIRGGPQDEAVLRAVTSLRQKLGSELRGSGLSYAVTGQPAIAVDLKESSGNAEKIVGLVTVLLILILPTIIFRSPFAALLSLVSVGLIYTMATSILAAMAQAFDFQVSGQLTSLLIVVLFGIGTDYILFLLFRYRERLRSGDHSRGAVSFALTRAGAAIFSAALVVGAAFTAMFAASLGFFSTLAPGLIVSVMLMMLASITLVPALLAIIGDKIFWPSKKWQTASTGRFAGKLGRLIARQPLRVAAASIAVLALMTSGLAQYSASFDLTSQLPTNTESGRAFKELMAAYPPGIASPTTVYVRSDAALSQESLTTLATALTKAEGVASVLPPQTASPPSGTAPVLAQQSRDGKAAVISLLLADDPTSDKAISNVAGPIRQAAHSTGLDAEIAVGGETATYADLKDATNKDIRTIVPLAAVMIFIILAVLLRSLVAPVYLLLSVALGVLATLGATTYAFTVIGDSSGLIFMLPILLYLFVVAVGTDYNILMISRLREEVHLEGSSPAQAAQQAVEHTASTLISAGVILAGTFASLAFAGLSLLTQMGFSVSLGIALGAFLISLILIPSLSVLLGKWVWWPSK